MDSPAERVLAPTHSASAAPLALALDATLAAMMNDRITSMKEYFDQAEAEREATNARVASLERAVQERDAVVDEMSRGLDTAWDRIELLEERLERVAQGDALQAKMEDIAASYQEQVDMMGREIEEVRESLSDESAVARAVEKAVDEHEAQGKMREELMTKQRRSLWLVQAFSRVRFGATSNLKQHVLECWWQRCLLVRRRRLLVVKTVGRLMMLHKAQVFAQWAAAVRMSLKHKLSAEISDIEARHDAVSARVEEELGSSATMTRLGEVERMVGDEAAQTRSLVHEFFEYQQQFEVDLSTDRVQAAADQRATLATVQVEMRKHTATTPATATRYPGLLSLRGCLWLLYLLLQVTSSSSWRHVSARSW